MVSTYAATRWYEKEGKYLTKKNTFNDFVDVAEHLAGGWCPRVARSFVAPRLELAFN